MKNTFWLVLCLICLMGNVGASAEPTFIQHVNALWKAKNYSQILQLATTEAAKQPPPPEAYAVLFGYHLFITANHEQAVQSLNGLLARLENSNPEAFQSVTDFKNDFLQAPSDQVQPPTAEQLDGLHQMFPDDFPIRSLLLLIPQPD
jgi:hypothetical protein